MWIYGLEVVTKDIGTGSCGLNGKVYICADYSSVICMEN